ncbi:hypothetical protein DPMN_175801 [Dreissena polymorpha]|uniref:Uncharacterized protein n=1 Tax=Dreissena polymorpha TaxID=45954 RepID=A0A9D4E8T9_DREPO|nr:hypothetical protein DPMN_175801 [Dreissena polymorpha]
MPATPTQAPSSTSSQAGLQAPTMQTILSTTSEPATLEGGGAALAATTPVTQAQAAVTSGTTITPATPTQAPSSTSSQAGLQAPTMQTILSTTSEPATLESNRDQQLGM